MRFERWGYTVPLRLRSLLRRGRVEAELDEELRYHLERQVEEHLARGLSEEEARDAALRAMGGVERRKEECRDARGVLLLEEIARDLRYGARALLRQPAFAAVAVLSLALGVGGTAAMFSLVDAALIRPLPYAEPDRLVRVSGYYPKGALLELQESRLLDIAAYTTDSEFNLTGQGEALHLAGSSVSANFFALLGVPVERGRAFEPGEDRPGRDRLVVLSHALWQQKFGGDPDAVGRPVVVDGVAREVVGVMPRDFNFPSPNVQLWVPLRVDPADSVDAWGRGYMPLVARLRPGATPQQAQGEIRDLISRVIPLFPFPMPPTWNADAAIVPLQQDLAGDVRGRLFLLFAAVALVLLIACANVASLLLARTAARQREITIRVALGASRGRIARQLLTESVLLAGAGAAAGLAMALGALPVLKAALPIDRPGLVGAGLDWRVLAFATALTVLTGLAFGLAPAVAASRLELAESLKARGTHGAGSGGTRMRSCLIVAEVALAVVLVASAGLLMKSLWRLAQVDPGFRPDQILTVRVYPDRTTFRERSEYVALYDELLRRAREIAGVSDAAAANTLPLSREYSAVPVDIEGHLVPPTENVAPMFWAGAVTPEYFRLMGVPLLAGRPFTEADAQQSEPVVVVSAATAGRFWPGENPVGKRLKPVWDEGWRTVVGVVGDVRQYDLAGNTPKDVRGAFYMPYTQSVGLDRQMPASMSLLLRTSADPARVAREIREIVAAVNPNVPVSEVRPMTALVSASASASRSLMWLFVSFAGAALLLAAIGTYGVVSYATAQRMPELGVRAALGATRGDLFGLVLRHSLWLALVGLAFGVAASLAATRALTGFLYGVGGADPTILLAVGGVVVATALIAGFLPARRAANADPLTVLRVD
jgi:putative ABC transport system permease protein